jgi:hypothetical protein
MFVKPSQTPPPPPPPPPQNQPPQNAKMKRDIGIWTAIIKLQKQCRERGKTALCAREVENCNPRSGKRRRRGQAAISSPPADGHTARERRPRTAPLSRAGDRAVEMRFATSLLGLDVDGNGNVHVWMICSFSDENMEKRFYFI